MRVAKLGKITAMVFVQRSSHNSLTTTTLTKQVPKFLCRYTLRFLINLSSERMKAWRHSASIERPISNWVRRDRSKILGGGGRQ